jgi:hypothetical protein
LVKQVTLKRIPRRDAITLAYICQLLLNSLGAINREESLRLEESRPAALSAAKLPPKIIWDIPDLLMNLRIPAKPLSLTNPAVSNTTGGNVNISNFYLLVTRKA